MSFFQLPPSIVAALKQVSQWPPAMRNVRIDQITLEAHKQYPELVRHPEDTSLAHLWEVQAQIARGYR